MPSRKTSEPRIRKRKFSSAWKSLPRDSKGRWMKRTTSSSNLQDKNSIIKNKKSKRTKKTKRTKKIKKSSKIKDSSIKKQETKKYDNKTKTSEKKTISSKTSPTVKELESQLKQINQDFQNVCPRCAGDMHYRTIRCGPERVVRVKKCEICNFWLPLK